MNPHLFTDGNAANCVQAIRDDPEGPILVTFWHDNGRITEKRRTYNVKLAREASRRFVTVKPKPTAADLAAALELLGPEEA